MENIDINELKKIQLKIMDEIDSFCRKNGFHYFMNYGTLIGAVRHKGYIPWDDDVDITMPRDEYDRFIIEFNKNRSNSFRAVSVANDPDYYLPFAKVVDTATVMKESATVDHEIGVYVDVFPMDRLPKITKKEERVLKRISLYRKLLVLKTVKVDFKRSPVKNLILFVSHLLLKPFSFMALIKKMDSLSQKYNNNAKCVYTGFFASQTSVKENLWEIDWFGEGVDVPFEGRSYIAPKNYDAVLKKTYGDYMQPPPREQQVSHHSFTAYYKR